MARAIRGWWLAALSLVACRPPAPAQPLRVPVHAPQVRAPEPGFEGRVALGVGDAQLPTAADVDDRFNDRIPGDRARVLVEDDAPSIGAALPLVTIVVFGDYQCPFSKRLTESLTRLAAERPAEVRVVFRQFPLPMHPQAELAAAAALAAHAQGRFADMHMRMFANQSALGRPQLEAHARALGLDPGRFADDLDHGRHADAIARDTAQGRHVGVRSTPSYFVNGRPFTGARPIEDLRAAVDEERELADALMQAGVPRPELYARFMRAADERPRGQTPTAQAPATGAGGSGAVLDDARHSIATTGLPRKGPAHARVVIVECGDFDCPYCGRAAGTLDQLLAKRHPEVSVVFLQFPLPFHKQARAAHRAAIAADNQGKFWDMHDLLFGEQRRRSDAELETMARKIGLDMRRYRHDIADAATEARIDRESATCQQLGASGTPTFFFNGRRVVGARPLADFEAGVDEESRRRP